jgi:predicted GNAT family N-acyltransferase
MRGDSSSLMSAEFLVRIANWQDDRHALQSVRLPVFVEEQKVDAREEFDTIDPVCVHFIALDNSGTPIGTGRIDEHGKIGRMAVVRDWRDHGVGKAILTYAIDQARVRGMKRVYLHSQVSALGFYERSGFVGYGDRFFEAGIEHLAMELLI